MSFNSYSPPPAEVIKTGQIAIGVLYAVLVFVPNTKRGAWIGALGSAAITLWVASQAKGDMAAFGVMLGPPASAVIGALIGATVSFLSKNVQRRLIPARLAPAVPTEQEEQEQKDLH